MPMDTSRILSLTLSKTQIVSFISFPKQLDPDIGNSCYVRINSQRHTPLAPGGQPEP